MIEAVKYTAKETLSGIVDGKEVVVNKNLNADRSYTYIATITNSSTNTVFEGEFALLFWDKLKSLYDKKNPPTRAATILPGPNFDGDEGRVHRHEFGQKD